MSLRFTPEDLMHTRRSCRARRAFFLLLLQERRRALSTAFRKKNLHHCLTEVKGRLEFVPESEGKTAKDVRAKMEEIMEDRGEGLVIKHPKAKYVLNGRNMDWIKVGIFFRLTVRLSVCQLIIF